jgi:hypothetical protein
MIPVETIPGMGVGRIKENGGGGVVNSSMIYLMCCKNFCKCHKVPPPSTIIKRGSSCPEERRCQLDFMAP